MLTELRVSNFALIKSLSVTFDQGLNVITGETGAGKSLILKSLQILMGGKAPTDVIGGFSESTTVEGFFDLTGREDVLGKLEDLSYLSAEEGLLVRRIISKKGKSKTYINGSLATVSELKSLVSPLIDLSASSEPLIELTSQHDNKNLQSPEYQRDIYDSFCKNKDLRSEVSQFFKALKLQEQKLLELENSESDRLQKMDFLNFQLSELDQFKPETSEYEELKEQKSRLSLGLKTQETYALALQSLKENEDSILSQLYTLGSNFRKMESDLTLNSKIEEATDLLESIQDELIAKNKEMQFEEEYLSLEDIQKRLETYEHLFRKYDTDSEGLKKIFEELKGKRDSLEQSELLKEEVLLEIESLKEKLEPLVESLSQSRKETRAPFEDKVNHHLQELNMKGLSFKVKIEEKELCEYGQDQISFWLSYNKDKVQERSIKKAASGGELSRILLAIKSSLESKEAPRTYLFDEIDAGVSGPTAEKVGKKLKTLAQGQQVITITHLPQVAALGEQHFLIEKSSGAKGQETELYQLKGEERIQEIARLISGENISDTSLQHAEKLMELS